MDLHRPSHLPLITLPYPSVLLPGVVLRIFIDDRRDVQALLAKITYEAFEKAPPINPTTGSSTPGGNEDSNGADGEDGSRNFIIGFVPLDPWKVSPENQNQNQNPVEGEVVRNRDSSLMSPVSRETAFRNIDPGSASPSDLCEIGIVGRVVGFEHGRIAGKTPFESPGVGAAILVEGLRRFVIKGITQKTPFLEAEVGYFREEVPTSYDTTLHTLFNRFKSLATELLHLLRVPTTTASFRSPPPPSAISRRLEEFINNKTIADAGTLVDFFIAAIDPPPEEKLNLLKTIELKGRLEKAIQILGSRVSDLRSLTGVAPNGTPRDGIIIRRKTSTTPTGIRGPVGPPGGFPGGPGGGMQDEETVAELDELQKKLDTAGLSSEASKIATREIARLRRMSPMQPEYSIQRTYLETLAEVPWSIMTKDKLDAQSILMAKKQLDDDHYGLEKVKRRLLEYMAILRLKLKAQEEVESMAAVKAVEIEKKEITEEKEDNSSIFTPPSRDERNPPTDEEQVAEPSPKSSLAVGKPPILLLVGPPGTGKTSLARSIATALGRKFHRISLGGVHNEAEIRGHRRTYIAAMPGLIVNGLRKVGVSNPVFLLDEIDKVGARSHNGDPSAALLEVLDPEQNNSFQDHYLSLPISLSNIIFICTANSLSDIPTPLLDRMETIHLSGYTNLEKTHIARRFLLPKQVELNGLSMERVAIGDEVLEKIINSYTREPGVRNLEREIGSICRFKAVQWIEATDQNISSSNISPYLSSYNPQITLADLETILGMEKYHNEIAEQGALGRPGVVNGLVAFSSGSGVMSGSGAIIFIEAAWMPGQNGGLKLTGNLGNVIRESVEVALTWVRAHAYDLGLTLDRDDDLLKNKTIHVHCPAGSDPKDGPSAGVAFTVALISLFSGRAVPSDIAMTGEVSLRGRITAVGAIKEKLIGALSAGITTVIVPARNRYDVRELPEEVKRGLKIVCAQHIWDVLKEVWPDWRALDSLIMPSTGGSRGKNGTLSPIPRLSSRL